MPLVIPGDVNSAVIKVDGLCYERVSTTSSNVTHEEPSNEYNDCFDCLSSSDTNDSPSLDSTQSLTPSSMDITYCVYSECCLLYTSPNPRDSTRARMPSSA